MQGLGITGQTYLSSDVQPPLQLGCSIGAVPFVEYPYLLANCPKAAPSCNIITDDYHLLGAQRKEAEEKYVTGLAYMQQRCTVQRTRAKYEISMRGYTPFNCPVYGYR